MAKKSKANTGFRNGNLFCFNCGRDYKIQIPQPVTMMVAMMKQFEKDHKNCAPTWKEPVADPIGKTEEENARWWCENGEHGMSSKTIYNRMVLLGFLPLSLKLDNQMEVHPSDPDDFRRCYLLLKAVPQWKSKLHMMKRVSPVWDKLVDHWDELTLMLEEAMVSESGRAEKMYELMQSLGC